MTLYHCPLCPHEYDDHNDVLTRRLRTAGLWIDAPVWCNNRHGSLVPMRAAVRAQSEQAVAANEREMT